MKGEEFMINLEDLKAAMGDLDEEKITAILDELQASGGEGADQALAACQEGMDIIGAKYESGEYFVAELIYAGDLMSDVAAVIKPMLTEETSSAMGKALLCTVKGDLHDIGKNIVKSLFEAAGIEVIDLGVDVEPAAIVAALKDNDAHVLALSGLLTLAINSMKETVDALIEAGFRDEVKVLIGGAAVTADYCEIISADAWSLNAAEGVSICRQWLAV